MGIYETVYLLLSNDYITRQELLDLPDENFYLEKDLFNEKFHVVPLKDSGSFDPTLETTINNLVTKLPKEKFNGYIACDSCCTLSDPPSNCRFKMANIVNGEITWTKR